MNRCLFAYTATHGRAYPEYLNVSATPDGGLCIIVRAPSREHDARYEGPTVALDLPPGASAELLARLSLFLAETSK
jgi:hypothetical protein